MGERQQRLPRDVLGERRDVGVVDHLHAVDLAVDVGLDDVVGDRARIRVGGPIGEARVAAAQLVPAEAQRGDAAAPGRIPALRSLLGELGGEAHAGADDLRVEAAREAAVAGDEQQADIRLDSCSRSSGTRAASPPAARAAWRVIRPIASAYGRSAAIRCSARRSLAAATISIARVIFWMFFTDAILFLTSR